MEIFFISDFQHTEHAIQCSTNRMWLIEWALNWQKTEVQTEKKNGQTERWTDWLTERWMEWLTDRWIYWQAAWLGDFQTGRGLLDLWKTDKPMDWQETDRQTGGLTDRWTNKQVDRQTDRWTDRKNDGQMHRLRSCLTGWLPGWQRTVRQKDRQAGSLIGKRKTDRQTDRQMDRLTSCLIGWLPGWQLRQKDRQADGLACRLAGDRQTDRWTDRQTDRLLDWMTGWLTVCLTNW